MVNENKICFLICVNDNLFFEECVRYIQWLEVPDGVEVEILEIREAASMASGYNEGMNSSDAKYKIYMHQDVFIVNRYFIYDVISIFNADKAIGVIGLVGSPQLPPNGVMWMGDRVGVPGKIPCAQYRYDMIGDGWWEVEAVDGLLMATQYDIPWREDLFDGWDFYDLSYSFEIKKRGQRAIVPVQKHSWFIHDDKEVLSLWNHNKYRKIFIDEYMKNR